MSKFIELTYPDDRKFYLNVDNIYYFVRDELHEISEIYTLTDGDTPQYVKETPAEIMAKIREVQNG